MANPLSPSDSKSSCTARCACSRLAAARRPIARSKASSREIRCISRGAICRRARERPSATRGSGCCRPSCSNSMPRPGRPSTEASFSLASRRIPARHRRHRRSRHGCGGTAVAAGGPSDVGGRVPRPERQVHSAATTAAVLRPLPKSKWKHLSRRRRGPSLVRKQECGLRSPFHRSLPKYPGIVPATGLKGIVEVVIDEAGQVQSASMVMPVQPSVESSGRSRFRCEFVSPDGARRRQPVAV